MTDAWRRKKYYAPRVVLEVDDILTPLFGDCLVCLSGSQLYMLRNLTQYLHRTSTFLAEYRDGYYLCADNDDWNSIQAIVADLENKLMDCNQFTADIQKILDSLGGGWADQLTTAIYDDLEDAGTIAWTYPDDTPVPAGENHCKLAQLVYAWNYDFLTEVVQPIQTGAHNFLLPLALAAIAVFLGGPAALVPGATLYAIINAALDTWVEGQLANVVNALTSNKLDLVCAMYEAWDDGGDYADAAAAAAGVIDTVPEWSAADKTLFKLTFSPFVMKICQDALTAGSDWANDNWVAAYCLACPGEPEFLQWTFPPCPNDWVFLVDCGCSGGNYLYMPSNPSSCKSPVWWTFGGTRDIELRITFRDDYPSPGAAIAFVRFEYSYNGTDWTPGNPRNLITTGNTNWHQQTENYQFTLTQPGALMRWYLGKSNAYSLEFNNIEFDLT